MKKKFDVGKEIRAIARERIGKVKGTKVIVPEKKKFTRKYEETQDD